MTTKLFSEWRRACAWLILLHAPRAIVDKLCENKRFVRWLEPRSRV